MKQDLYIRNLPVLGLATAVLLILHLTEPASSQQDFTRAQVPNFILNVFYPARASSAAAAEALTCRAITDRISRNSARFNKELVTNTNRRIIFSSPDSRIMSSRMQSRLDRLADLYYNRFRRRRMTVLKAWTSFPDSDLIGDENSLHYEGRTVRVSLSRSSDYDDFLELAVEASFDWVYYANRNYVRLSVIPSNCERNVDCVFLLDRSGSVGKRNHALAIQFIRNVVSFFNIRLNSSRVGMAAYSTSSAIQFDLDDHTTVSALQKAIGRVKFTSGSTNTPAALNHARLLLNPANNRGARDSSEGIPKITILITDGKSNRGNLRAAAPALRNSGVQVYAVGIGRIDVGELREIASDPDDEHVFILRSYLDAAGFVDFLSVTTCDTPAIVDPGDNTTTEVPDGGIKYFLAKCPAFSDKVLVEVIDNNGTSFLYCSAVETNPGPLTLNTIRNETMGIRRRTGIVRLPKKVVYIGIQGQGVSDSFTLIVWDQLFEPSDAFIDVMEGVVAGQTIYDVRNNLTNAAQRATYRYSIIEGNDNGIFAINPNTGRVFIPGGSPGINFSVQQTHNLTVKAQNVRAECQRSRIRIHIRVISNRISFNNLPPQQVPESAASGTVVVGVVATGGAGNIRYSFVSGNANNAFSIGANSGIVRVNGQLDFETTPNYAIIVRAQSTGTGVSGEITLSITVTDVNEPHVFTTPCALTPVGCQFNIDENLLPTLLGTVEASDPDQPSSPNGMLSYRFNTQDFPFSVSSSGAIRSTQSLDREERDSYALVLIVRDGCVGNCSIEIRTNIRIIVNDINDNNPLFTSAPATVEVSEDAPNNLAVAEYIATDADIGQNAEIEFSLSPTNVPFTLSVNGILSLTGDIDFEMRQSYMIMVTASNPGSTRSNTTNTVIQILNVNDNSPIFEGDPFSANVTENSNDRTSVLTVTANDADLGVFGDVRYFIVGGNFNSSFSIDSVSGQILVQNNIDREAITSFDLEVKAQDLGMPLQRSARTTVSITVLDVNDNRPIFRPSTYSVQLREDLPVGHDVVQVFASDLDQPNTPNSRIIYSIASGNGEEKFRINSSSGEIKIRSGLDFETTPSFILTISARDGGSPIKMGSAKVNITVINVNEDPPQLMGDQVVEVSELLPVNTVVAVFQALDPDQMQVTFNITSGNEERKFSIGLRNGTITLIASLDYETTTGYLLGITASDGQRTAMASLNVTVLDENEFAPDFVSPNLFIIREEERAGVTVETVRATDGDRDSIVTYSFPLQDRVTDYFNLDAQTGVITTSSVLDREQLTQIFTPPSSIATIVIAAEDNGSPSKITFKDHFITLLDINDNNPVFSDSEYANSLSENLPSGQIVFEPEATDADLGTNAVVRYSFILNNNLGMTNPFQIDAVTGVITTLEPLDCELQPFYTFTISAEDMGTPITLISSVLGNLSIIDENDNSPIFNASVYRRTISEGVNQRTPIVTVLATDADKGLNGQVEYSVVNPRVTISAESSEIITIFQIDINTGLLINANLFDFESASQINLTVFANDRGVPRRSARALVIIDILNVDELAPFFLGNCDAFIREDAPIGTRVTQCMAEDIDTVATEGQFPIIYSLETGNLFFRINPDTGEITTAASLDRETDGAFGLSVVATDLAGLFARRQVVIRLIDINDNPPEFLNVPYNFQFTDSTVLSQTQPFLAVSAVDPDLLENGTFLFDLGRTFQLNTTETRVEVIAYDMGTPQMNSTINISVSFQSPCELQTYSITPSEGQVSARLLCSVALSPPSSLPIVLGGTNTLTCTIIHNGEVTYQWLQNGSIITSPRSIPVGTTSVNFLLTGIVFEDAGDYSCKPTSPAGSLQTPITTASIQVSPVIVMAPQITSAQLSSTATLTCSATGIPQPTIEWFVGTEKVGEGNVLPVMNVDPSMAGAYTCGASSDAGSTASSARLIVYDKFNVVELEINDVNNPIPDENCQYFDPKSLESVLNQLTNQKAMVTNAQGEGLCETTPCTPSPCQNGGTCSLNEQVMGGYECECRQEYLGVNCTEDENECNQNPCGGEGQCSNTKGSYNCLCNSGRTGRRCQFIDLCNSTLCGQDEVCVEIFTDPGYKCVVPNRTSSVVVGGASRSNDELSDFVQLYIEAELALINARRRKRQTVRLTTACEPRFISDNTSSGDYIQFWLCPVDEEEPSPEAQQGLCEYLFELGVVEQCKLPYGEFMIPPTTPPIPSVNVKVMLVMVDSSNRPIDALDSVKDLEDKGALEELVRSGFSVSAITAQTTEPRPEKTEEDQGNSGAVAGGVVSGVLVVLLLVTLVTIIVGVILYKRKKEQELRSTGTQLPNLGNASNSTYKLKNVTDSSENLLNNVPPERPPKPTPIVKSSNELDESIYQNVTKSELPTSTNSVVDSDYDTLPPMKTSL